MTSDPEPIQQMIADTERDDADVYLDVEMVCMPVAFIDELRQVAARLRAALDALDAT